jgi:hypothetical protein
MGVHLGSLIDDPNGVSYRGPQRAALRRKDCVRKVTAQVFFTVNYARLVMGQGVQEEAEVHKAA